MTRGTRRGRSTHEIRRTLDTRDTLRQARDIYSTDGVTRSFAENARCPKSAQITPPRVGAYCWHPESATRDRSIGRAAGKRSTRPIFAFDRATGTTPCARIGSKLWSWRRSMEGGASPAAVTRNAALTHPVY